MRWSDDVNRVYIRCYASIKTCFLDSFLILFREFYRYIRYFRGFLIKRYKIIINIVYNNTGLHKHSKKVVFWCGGIAKASKVYIYSIKVYEKPMRSLLKVWHSGGENA